MLLRRVYVSDFNPMDYSPPGFSVLGFSRQVTGAGCSSLLWGIFPTQGSNPGLPIAGTSEPSGKLEGERGLSEKVGLQLNIHKKKIMASDPITLWKIDGETMETVADFIFLGSKITADGDCSHEIKR